MHCGYTLMHSGTEGVHTRSLHRVYIRPKRVMDTEDRFSHMTVSQLKHYLCERDVVVSKALKQDLVARCRAACLLNLQPKPTPEEYKDDIANRRLSKLILDGGIICLPDTHNLRDGWEDSPSSYPHLLQSGIETYVFMYGHDGH